MFCLWTSHCKIIAQLATKGQVVQYKKVVKSEGIEAPVKTFWLVLVLAPPVDKSSTSYPCSRILLQWK